MKTPHSSPLVRLSPLAAFAVVASLICSGCLSTMAFQSMNKKPAMSPEQARAWAEREGKLLDARIPPIHLVAPRPGSELVGTWNGEHSLSGLTSVAAAGETESRTTVSETYTFRADGTYEKKSGMKIDILGKVSNQTYVFSGTWKYDSGMLTLTPQNSRVGMMAVKDDASPLQFDVLWHESGAIELRVGKDSWQERVKDVEKGLRKGSLGLMNAMFKTWDFSYTDNGVKMEVMSSIATTPFGSQEQCSAFVATPEILVRHGQPNPMKVTGHQAGSQSTPAIPALAKNAAWRIVEKTTVGEFKSRYVIDLDGENPDPVGADREIRPLVCAEGKAEFEAANPGCDPDCVQATAVREISEGGRRVAYTVSAFTSQLTVQFIRYDADSRRGIVSYKLNACSNEEAAMRYARENIGQIVLHENVAIEVGKAPPPGAKFAFLNIEQGDGVLTVEFEAVQ